jgi:3D (Asp-Asp-Asp) domain-containing protein
MKKQLVSSGIILALLGSNLITGYQYISDSRKYEQKISQKSKIISQNEEKLIVLTEKSVKNEQKLSDFSNKIDLLTVELEKVKKENQDLTKENKQIKKELPSRGEVNQQRKFYVEATAYTANCKEGCTGITYTEYDVRNTIYYKGLRVIASDNSVLPLYSIVRVDANNESFEAIVLDRGGGINGFEIDVLVKNEHSALQFGRQKVLITVLREGKS